MSSEIGSNAQAPETLANEGKKDRSSGGLVKAAVGFALRGIPVVPIHYPVGGACSCSLGANCSSVAKHPMTPAGFKDHSRDLNKIGEWWKRYPKANIGVLTGSISGIGVLDVDLKNGGLETFHELESKIGPLKVSRWAVTGGGGFHIYFALNKSDGILPSRIGVLPGIDFKAEGGYVVAPPSLHASGKTYKWDESVVSYKEIPPKLLEVLRSPNSKNRGPTVVANSYPKAQAHYSDPATSQSKENIDQTTENLCEVTDVGRNGSNPIKSGKRNNTLVCIGGVLRRLGWDSADILEVLDFVNERKCDSPLSSVETSIIAKGLSRYQTIKWQAPIQLSQHHQHAPSLDPSLLPSSLSDYFLETARILQVPLDYLVIPTIVAFSSIISRNCSIKPLNKAKWRVVPNLWGLLCADPGSLKSPAISEALSGLFKLTQFSREKWEKLTAERKLVEMENKLKMEEIRNQIKQKMQSGKSLDVHQLRRELAELELAADSSNLVEDRVFITDATVEKISVILASQPSIFMVRDELSGWLLSLQKSGHEGDREFYLEAWNGNQPYRIERIGRGAIHVPRLCASIFGGIQPQKLANYIEETCAYGTDDGFLERFQLMVAPAPIEKRQVFNESLPEHLTEALEKVYFSLYNRTLEKEPERCLEFNEEAQRRFEGWLQELENRLVSSYPLPIMRAHLSKYRSLIPSLAGIFATIKDCASGEGPNTYQIDNEDLCLAIAWGSYLEHHAWTIYKPHLTKSIKPAVILSEKIRSGEICEGDTLRAICRAQWSGLTKMSEIQEGIDLLVALNWVKIETVRSQRQPVSILRINPSLTINA